VYDYNGGIFVRYAHEVYTFVHNIHLYMMPVAGTKLYIYIYIYECVICGGNQLACMNVRLCPSFRMYVYRHRAYCNVPEHSLQYNNIYKHINIIIIL
jgi:hypothetical protein